MRVFFLTHANLSRAYQLKGNYPESVEHQARAVELGENPQNAAPIRESFAKGGWEGYLRYMTRDERQGRASSYELARFYTALGDIDKAIAALNSSYDEREIPLYGIKTDPLLDPLRDDLRFQEVVKKLNFPE
jgi:tetratricopeptide (TPR) repeat protein